MRLISAAALTLFALPALAQQASVAATDGTNALGSIPCADLNGALGNCPAEYLDKGDGKATLRVLLPGGATRSLYIEDGTVASSDSTDKVRAHKSNGTVYVFVGEAERFEIPATAVE